MKAGLNDVAQEAGCPVRCVGIDVHPRLDFSIDDAAGKRQAATLYIQEMAKRGCHGYASFYLNAAQGAVELAETLVAARETFAIIRAALD